MTTSAVPPEPAAGATASEATQSSEVRVGLKDGVLTLTLDRPEKKNALTGPMYSVLAEQIERAETDPEVRVVLLRAEGELFTAGNDLGEFLQIAQDQAPAEEVLQSPVWRFLRALAASTTPIVAAVQGKAVGVGTTALLHCDVVVLSEDAQLITPFVDLGLVPEAASTLLLPQILGHARAFALLALGQQMGAEEAVQRGLASAVVPRTELDAQALRAAQTLAAKPACALSATKALLRDGQALAAQMDREGRAFHEQLLGPEAQTALAAFGRRSRG